MNFMKLKPRTTYRNKNGDLVNIAGLAQSHTIEGERIFWSIQGDWYSETGRFVYTRKIPVSDPKPGHSLFNYISSLMPPVYWKTISHIEDAKEAHDWWKGVKTERL